MEHLFDTCTFLNKIPSPSAIIDLGKFINTKHDNLAITNVIIEELEPKLSLPKNQIEKSNGILKTIDVCEKKGYGTKIININENPDYKANFEKIRKRYYSHISPFEIRRRIKNGELTFQQGKSLKKKDFGECSCIAIAVTNSDLYIIISEDKGRVCERPEINIFDIYRKRFNIKIFKYDEWFRLFCS